MNLIRNHIYLIIFIWINVLPIHARQPKQYPHSLDSLYAMLDDYLEQRQHYTSGKENQIVRYRTALQQATTPSERFKACLDLYGQYRSYKYDSAYAYAHNAHLLAIQIGRNDYDIKAKCAVSFCLLSSGLFKEAFDMMSQINAAQVTDSVREQYYSLYSRLYYDIADYNQELPFQQDYITYGTRYADSLLTILPPHSIEWTYINGQKQMKLIQYDKCIQSFETLLNKPQLDTHTEAIVASSLGWVYWGQGNKENAKRYLARAAIADICSATKETTALRVLATFLYDDGDIDRANRYVKLALEDANFYNARHRKIEIGSIMPLIEQSRFDMITKQRNLLIGGILLFSLLIIMLLVTTFIIYKQVKKLRLARHTIEERNNQLQQTNRQLSEVSHIKDEYIGSSFYLNAEYINKTENLYKLINRKIAAHQFDDLRTNLKESTLCQERNNMYASFDETFLKLFPSFISAWNELFPPQEAMRATGEQSLTSEMRIFALIRLGINESDRIARFLNYSVNTINTYKTRIKNKSLVSNEQFEAHIMAIESVSK